MSSWALKNRNIERRGTQSIKVDQPEGWRLQFAELEQFRTACVRYGRVRWRERTCVKLSSWKSVVQEMKGRLQCGGVNVAWADELGQDASDTETRW